MIGLDSRDDRRRRAAGGDRPVFLEEAVPEGGVTIHMGGALE